jgi:hypothetical protein
MGPASDGVMGAPWELEADHAAQVRQELDIILAALMRARKIPNLPTAIKDELTRALIASRYAMIMVAQVHDA